MGNGCLELFKTYLSNTKKCSENTLDAYLRDVNQFVLYCSQNGAKSVEKITETYITKYIEYLTSYEEFSVEEQKHFGKMIKKQKVYLYK